MVPQDREVKKISKDFAQYSSNFTAIVCITGITNSLFSSCCWISSPLPFTTQKVRRGEQVRDELHFFSFFSKNHSLTHLCVTRELHEAASNVPVTQVAYGVHTRPKPMQHSSVGPSWVNSYALLIIASVGSHTSEYFSCTASWMFDPRSLYETTLPCTSKLHKKYLMKREETICILGKLQQKNK